MKHLAFVALMLVLAALEGALPRVLPIGAFQPLLLVPLVLAFALRLQTGEGAALSAVAGFVLDATGGWPTGLATFSCVALFIGSRLALGALRADGTLFEAAFTFALAAAWHALSLGVVRWVGPAGAPMSELPFGRTLLASCLATALVSPLVLAAARRIDRIGARPPGALS